MTEVQRFTKLEIVLEDDTRVALTDGRSCATNLLLLVPACTAMFSWGYWHECMSERAVVAGKIESACILCRFAKVFTCADPLNEEPISKLGKDSYTELPEEDAFCELLATHRRSIKAVLLDQAVLCGIGNWVADEVLYQAKLYPERAARDLLEAEMKLLRTAIKGVLATAVQVDADAARLPREWLFHYRCARFSSSSRKL